MNKLYSLSDFKKILESRDYEILGKNVDDLINIVSELGYDKIPVFYRNTSSETHAKVSNGAVLKLSDISPRSPIGTNKKNLENIMSHNPDFPDRRKSIFMRTQISLYSGSSILIPYKNTRLGFCSTYDFNQELIDEIYSENDYDENYIVAINNYFRYTYNANKPNISKILNDLTRDSKFYKLLEIIIKELNLGPRDSPEKLFDYFLNLKNFGFYTKLGSELIHSDFEKNVEVWTEGPVILCGVEKFVESKLPQL